MTSRKPRRKDAAPSPELSSPGEERLAAVPEATRGGEDVRRRGWFWHWNALVTQYAPLIGLKGVGLLNSYTVWTDRREESPHRGYAFPSQQSEADFYGEDRAELITINKILVALDLIEIRKEMVLRADPQGRRWKVPHNFYRVKDHGDDFTLGTPDVLRVAELAARDRAVYRYVRRVFSPRFSPIDGANVWGRILPEVRQTPVWQELAARTAKEEDRASARTRAGHAARKETSARQGGASAGSDESLGATPFFAPSGSAGAAMATDGNDSDSVASDRRDSSRETSVDAGNTGLAVDVDGTNRGSRPARSSSVAPVNDGGPTSVAPSNTTYHQSETTTNDGELHKKVQAVEVGDREPGDHRRRSRRAETTGGPARRPPADAAGEAAALRAFESANDRPATPAERKLLRDLAARFESVAEAARQERPDDDLPASGWSWLEAAVWEAVEAGSAYLAPRRLREILLRWEREGFPRGVEESRSRGVVKKSRQVGKSASRQVNDHAPYHPITHHPSPTFAIEEVGLSNRQVWAAALAEMTAGGAVSRGDLETWLRPAGLIGRDGETLIVGAPNAVARDRIATRLLPALRAALAATVGVDLEVVVMVEGECETASGQERQTAS